MPIVNYVQEHIRFMEYACDEKLTSSERLLWYALMHVMNQRAQGKVWPEDFVHISNDRLLLLCPMKFDTLAKARNSLKQRGLIEYEPGDKNKKNPAYRMNYFLPLPYDAEGYTEISDNMGDNMGDNRGDNTGDNRGYNTGDNTGDIYINNKHIPGTIHYDNREGEEDEESISSMLEDARARIRKAWINTFGQEPAPIGLRWLVNRGVKMLHFEPEVVCEAIHMAGFRVADSPMDYINRLFMDWTRQEIRTEDELEDYLEERGA